VFNVHRCGSPDCNRQENLQKNPANQHSKKNGPGDAPTLRGGPSSSAKDSAKKNTPINISVKF